MGAILMIAGSSYCRLASSAHTFTQRFEELGKSDVNTVERLVFSLVLAKAETPKTVSSELPQIVQ
jgi:hypothetical protein